METKDDERQLSMAVVTATPDEADKIAKRLVRERLAAGVQVTAPVTSYFWWDNEVQMEKEVVLFLKTDIALKKKIETVLAEEHSYEVPELIFLPIQEGLKAYLDWMDDELA